MSTSLKTILILFILLHCRTCFGQKGPSTLSSNEIDQINKFNRLFGDYFYVNENMEILPLNNPTYRFDQFYKTIRDTNWTTDFDQNLDDNPLLRSNAPNVITMNLKFEKGGFFPETPSPKQEEKNKALLNKKQLFVSDTIQKISSRYRSVKNAKQKVKMVESKTDSLIRLKINETLNNIAYQKDFDLNGYHLKNFALTILGITEKYHIKHIYFFAHGYNVPYALAQMQGNRLLKEIQNQHTDTILFIRIFWKGGDAKKLIVKTRKKNQHVYLKKVIYKDRIRIKNATGFKRKTKEAIKCGYSLRRLLHLLESDKEEVDPRTFHLFSHSLGAVLISHSVINNISQIRYKPDELVKITREAHYSLDANWMRRADSLMYTATCKPLKRIFGHCSKRRREALEYISFMRYTPLPDLRMRFFMNAPAIPGVQLFQFANVCHNYHFMVGYNIFDPTLAKRFAGKKTLISGKLSYAAGNTSLGLNYKNEVGKTEFLINTNQLKSPNFFFKGYRTSNFFEHDLFFYMQHPLFTNALKVFTAP